MKSLTTNYRKCIFSGLLLHLLFKIIFSLAINLELGPIYNIITMIICIVICQIYDVYYYIITGIGRFIYYICFYIPDSPFEFLFWTAVGKPVAEAYLHYYICSDYCNWLRDRFYFFHLLFFPFLLLRVFIIKEPALFFILHVFLIISYLQDKNLFYTYIYTLTVTYK
jgi:hypothetical protein